MLSVIPYPPIGKMACDILLMFDGFLVVCNLCQSADMQIYYLKNSVGVSPKIRLSNNLSDKMPIQDTCVEIV